LPCVLVGAAVFGYTVLRAPIRGEGPRE
jgi:hypothetical protein